MDEKKDLANFIFQIGEFNGCIFCKRFGYFQSCPTVAVIKKGERLDETKLERANELCKAHIMESLKNCFSN